MSVLQVHRYRHNKRRDGFVFWNCCRGWPDIKGYAVIFLFLQWSHQQYRICLKMPGKVGARAAADALTDLRGT